MIEPHEVSPGQPIDSDTDVEWTEPVHEFLVAGDVPPLAAPYGFGAATTGGHGGKVLHVTKVKDDPAAKHSLRWAVEQAGPTWIVFDDDLTFNLKEPLRLGPDTTLDGRGHRVRIHGNATTEGIRVEGVENVIVHGIDLSGFGDPEAPAASNPPHDAIYVLDALRVWIDHCSLSEATDKTLAVSRSREVTVTGNHFHHQAQTFQMGNMTNANGDVHNTVTVAWNHFDHCGYRCPVVSYGKAHVFNNLIDNWSAYGTRSQRIGQTFLEGNIYQAGDDPNATLIKPASDGSNDSGSLVDDRDGYLYDVANLYLGKCKKQSTGPEHMFNPKEAYHYQAEQATEDLAARIAAHAGPPVKARTPRS